jgi:outer membrane biosynthesis protein TonB
MAALGRLLGILGWLWFIAGFVAPALDIADIEFFPGLILVFVGRMLRGQARRQEPEPEAEPVTTEPPPRQLNTERTKPEPTPQPVARTPPILTTPTSPPPPIAPEMPAEEEEEEVREKLFSAIRSAAAASADDEAGIDVEVAVKDAAGDKPLTSEEMIARARQRWDRRD